MSKNNCAILTYTNKNCRDVWPVYFGQLTKHAPFLKSYVLTDSLVECADGENIIYENDQPYYLQWLQGLDHVKEDFVIYAQEDFVLYDDVKKESIDSYIEFLKSHPEYSYVRPIRCGFDNSLIPVSDGLFEVPVSSDDIFQMQITIWKKEYLKKLYSHVQSVKWYESAAWRQGCRDLNIRGVFSYYGEPKRGKYHFDSSTYPYVCTAVSRGLWNLNEYKQELGRILDFYRIDPTKRGIRFDYNYSK